MSPVAHLCPLGFFISGHCKTNSVTEHSSARAAVWGSAGVSHFQHSADEGPGKGEQRSPPTGSIAAMLALFWEQLLKGRVATGLSCTLKKRGQTSSHMLAEVKAILTLPVPLSDHFLSEDTTVVPNCFSTLQTCSPFLLTRYSHHLILPDT